MNRFSSRNKRLPNPPNMKRGWVSRFFLKTLSLRNSKYKKNIILVVLGLSLLTLTLVFLGVFCLKVDPSPQFPSIVYLKASCPDFCGREIYLQKLYRDLIESKKQDDFSNASHIRVLWGKGGYGKTELVIEFANRYLHHYALVWTFYCDNFTTLDQGYRNLAEKLGILNSNDSSEKVKDKVHFYLENHSFDRPWLLIYDNVEEGLTSYPQRGGAILITTQNKILSPQFLIEVKPFSMEESLQLLEKVTFEKQTSEMEKLARDLDNIPLLINHAAHYIRVTPGSGFSEYIDFFYKTQSEKLGPLWDTQDVNQRYLKSLAISWQLPLKNLESTDPEALKWLNICCYFYPENISENWLDSWLLLNSSEQNHIAIKSRQRILKILSDFGIIRYSKEEKSFSLHRFFQLMIRTSRQDHLRQDLTDALTILEDRAKSYNFFNVSTWKNGECWHFHANQMDQWLVQNSTYLDSPDIKRLQVKFYLEKCRWSYFSCNYPEALEAGYKALNLCQELGEINTHLGLRVYNSIAWSHYRSDQISQALEACLRAEEIQKCLVDVDPLAIADTLNTKGLVFYDLEEYAESVNCHQKALEIRLKYPSQELISRSLHNMAFGVRALGRYQEALDLFKRAAQMKEKSSGVAHPTYVWCLMAQARTLAMMGNSQDAEILALKTIKDYLAVHKSSKGQIGYAWCTLGFCYQEMNKLKKAKQMYQQALSEALEFNKPNLELTAYEGIGDCFLKEKSAKKALEYYLKSLKLNVELYHQSSKKMISIFEGFKNKFLEIRSLAPALALNEIAKEVYQLSEKILGSSNAVTIEFEKMIKED